MRRLSPIPTLSCLFLLSLAVVLPGCQGDDGGTSPTPTTGSMTIDVEGLPAGTDCRIQVSGPDFFAETVTGDVTLNGLAEGSYGLSIASEIDGYVEYSPDRSAVTVTVRAGEMTEVPVDFEGTISRGHLQVDVTGLPNGVSGDVLITGPFGFSRAVDASTLIESVQPGRYTVVAAAVAAGSSAYFPGEASEEIEVDPGETATRAVVYAEGDIGNVDFWISGIELVQSTQRALGDVPLIRSRDALARIYVQSAEATPFLPDVRLEIAVNGSIVHTETITPDYGEVPLSTARGDLATTVNWVIPANWVQPELEIRATVDPSASILEADESNNAFPSAEDYASYSVATLDPMGLTLVPVRHSVNGLEGDVDPSNIDDYDSMAEAMYPVPSYQTTLRAVYTTDAPALTADNSGDTWSTVLSEVEILRNTGGTSDNYFGVVATTYGSGIAGLGYIPASRSQGYRTAIGWDKPNSRNGVAAHEMGHNLGLRHAPCGGPSGTDAEYPYGGALIGAWGYDTRSAQLVDPANTKDIMSYCNPQWISDYNFERVLNWLDGVITSRAVSSSPQACLVVWGRVGAGGITLEPSFVTTARPQMPSISGAYQVDVLDDGGRSLAALSFDPPEIGCDETGTRSFVWFVPIDATETSRVGTIAMHGNGRSASQVARTVDAAAARRIPMALDRVGARTASLRWDATSLPLAVVRDARNGAVLAIGRHGDFDFVCDAPSVDVTFSDGARTLEWTTSLD